MPKHFGFVLAAYLIWTVSFLAYFLHLYRKQRHARRAMARLDRSAGPEGARE